MSFRLLLGLVLLVAIAVASASFIFLMAYLRGAFGDLLPIELALEIQDELQMLLLGGLIVLLILTLVLAGGIFWVIGEFVAKPLQRIVNAMNSYTSSGQRQEVPEFDSVPTEIQSLSKSFTSFMDRVDDSHKRDVEVSRVKSDFISTAAHQLRTPLTGIRWALEALQKENLTENQMELVKSATDKSRDLVAIVGTLLDISSIESGKYKYDFKPVDLDLVLQELAADFEPLAKERQVSLFYARSESPLPPARADRERIKWVLSNLIDNALQYTPAGGTVRLSIESAERRVFIRVKDTGIGIPPEVRGNIFERFYRAPNAISKENQGNGLGLYIARTIATDHGGDLSFAANTEGPGTTFILSLPVL